MSASSRRTEVEQADGVGETPLSVRRERLLADHDQRAILRSELDYVVVRSLYWHGRRFDPARVQVVWRDEMLPGDRTAGWLTTNETIARLQASAPTGA